MNLVKWFRKNNTKVMAVVVIVILFGFIGGGTFLQYLSKRSTGMHQAVAYFGDDEKVTRYDIALAQEELKVLRMVGADDLLRSIGVPLFNTPDMHALLLGELLFFGSSEQRTSPTVVRYIKQAIRANEYRISNKQINDFYPPARSMPGELYWLLLRNEVELAGMRVKNEDARKLFIKAIEEIPRFRGATYRQVMSSLVSALRIPEKRILSTLGKLLVVLEYAKMSCLSGDITSSQIMQTVSREGETIDVSFVKFDSTVFVETQTEPNQERIDEHFNKYLKFFAGTASEENPYGFGYKLADRVRLEYIACRIEDVSTIVTPPSQEEAEKFYQTNREQFTEEVPSDPNEPNSPLIEQIKSYAEVAGIISQGLLQNKIDSKAKSILVDAKALTEAGLQDIDTESGGLSAEQLKQRAGNYKTAAEELTEEYKIEVYSGQTGLLGAADIQTDEYLGSLYIRGYGETFVGLPQIVFAIDELGLSELGPFDASKPRMYENIGPVRDMLGRIMAIVRVIDVQKASEPESINQTFSTGTLRFETAGEDANEGDPNDPSKVDLETEDVYSVKEKVTEDLKRLAAMDTTKKKAEEFIGLAAKDGWESTIEKFNKLYGRQGEQDETDPNISEDPNATNGPDDPFKLENQVSLQRISLDKIGKLVIQSEGNPAARLLVNGAEMEKQFIDKLYSLVPQDSNTVDVPLIMEFKPDMSYFCIKEISVRRVYREEYEQVKPLKVYTEEHIQSQSLAAVHFNPENIIKRMDFRWIGVDEQTVDTNQPPESGESS